MSIALTETFLSANYREVIETGTFTPSGSYVVGGEVFDFSQTNAQSSLPPVFFQSGPYAGYDFQYVPGAGNTDGKLKIFSSGTGDAAATGTLTSDNTNVSNNDTVMIGTVVYTFKTALTGAAYEVKIGSDADTSLGNFVKAINASGTAGTDYGLGTLINAQVSAGAVTSHATVLTAKVSGSAGNAIATTETSAHLSFGAATLASGTDATSGGKELTAATYPTDLSSAAIPFRASFQKNL